MAGLAFAGLWVGPAVAQTHDMCALLSRNPDWAEAVRSASRTWKVSPGSLLTVIDQESRFNAYAKGAGAVDANSVRNFGFAQANLRTWNWFLRETGRNSGSRSNFALSVDFVGWHFTTMEARTGVKRDHFAPQYLIYKLGEGGYRRGAPTYARRLANRLEQVARSHDEELAACGFEPKPGSDVESAKPDRVTPEPSKSARALPAEAPKPKPKQAVAKPKSDPPAGQSKSQPKTAPKAKPKTAPRTPPAPNSEKPDWILPPAKTKKIPKAD